jgi:hypothetical protein
MKKQIFITSILLTVISISFGQNINSTSSKEINEIENIQTDHNDTIELKETFNQENIPVNDYLTERLKPIRANFARINLITDWTSINKKDLRETTEGGEGVYYYLNKRLEKIVIREYGEMFQQLTEYYLIDNHLSFVFEKSYKYNRPIYYDTKMMKENNDTEAFDFEKSEIIEDRSYFENGKLIHQLNNQDCGSQFADDYLLEEQQRILANFEQLMKLEKEKYK